jgi:predicted nucleic acid-binding protein
MIVLDTNVLSELMRPTPHPSVIRWIQRQPSTELFTTAITEAEIFFGIALIAKGKRHDALGEAAELMFTEDFAGRVLGFDGQAARSFARIAMDRRLSGRPISHADAQIAAIVKLHKASLATRNVDDFVNCEIPVIDPWAS